MRYFTFCVLDAPFCVWEHDLPARNDSFLKSLDPDYFAFLADTFRPGLDGENRQRSAVALRAGYHHGLETLFTLIGGFLQAPACVPAWIPHCRTETLRELVERINRGVPLRTGRGLRQLRWSDVAREVHACAYQDDPPEATAERFAGLWSRFAQDFLNKLHIAEYNSIKHGFRVNPGGFVLRMGEQREAGEAAPPEAMRTLGGSTFGARFFIPEPVLPEGAEHRKANFRIRRLALNWDPNAIAERLYLLAMSCKNVVSATRAVSGTDPTTVTFFRPENPESFEMPWRTTVGVTSSNMDSVVDPDEITPFSRSEIVEDIEARGRKITQAEAIGEEGLEGETLALVLSDVWHSKDRRLWRRALRSYWEALPERQLDVERRMAAVTCAGLAAASPDEWLRFLREDFYPWKFTQGNILANSLRHLRAQHEEIGIGGLDSIRQRLLNLDPADAATAIHAATRLKGLGVAGGTGLLSIIYPEQFGTLDQFVVKSLRLLEPGVPEWREIVPGSLDGLAGVMLTHRLRAKAEALSTALREPWTPRQLDMILWAARAWPDSAPPP